MEEKYLSVEEQFNKALSNKEIKRIKDPELKEIRYRHWSYRNKIFFDESNITDQELMRLTNIDYDQEKRELELYRKQKGI